MDRTTKPNAYERVTLCIEVVKGRDDRGWNVRVVVSIPGRESTIAYRWPTPTGLVDDQVAPQIATTIERAVWHALGLSGVQGTLPT